MKMPHIKIDKYVVMVILLIIAALLVPVACRLFSVVDLWVQMAGAVLGIVFGAVITSVMLKWQTRTEAEQERDSRVYEQKLLVCLDFLKEICEILRDGKVTAEEANKLRFDFANIAIHLSEKSLLEISESLGLIVESCGRTGEEAAGLEEHVLRIVTVFRSEMYSMQHSDKALKGIADNLRRIADQVETETDYSGDATGREDAAGQAQVMEMLVQQLRKQISENWEIKSKGNNEVAEITYRREPWNTPEQLCIRLTHDSPDFHYFQCHINLSEQFGERRNLYMPMRAALGGRLNKYCWWRRMDEHHTRLLTSGSRTEVETEQLLGYLVQELVKIVAYAERFITTNRQLCDFREEMPQEQWCWAAYGNEGVLLIHKQSEALVGDFVCQPDGRFTSVRLILRDLSAEQRLHCLSALGLKETDADTITLASEISNKAEMATLLRKLTAVRL